MHRVIDNFIFEMMLRLALLASLRSVNFSQNQELTYQDKNNHEKNIALEYSKALESTKFTSSRKFVPVLQRL